MAINKIGCFSAALSSPAAVLGLPDFNSIFQAATAHARTADPNVSGQALGNARGSWYEWLIMLGAADWSIATQSQKTLVLLPNKSTLNLEKLYDPAIARLVTDLRQKVAHVGVNLITSNPDFLIVQSAALPVALPSITGAATANVTQAYTSFYQQLLGACQLADVVGYASCKASTRPDRRIQFVHEGSLMKALHKHIQTRLWLPGLDPIEFYAITQQASAADAAAMATVATHSIVSVDIEPKRAVDQLWEIASGQQLQAFCAAVLG